MMNPSFHRMETKKIAFAVIYLALLVTHLSEAQNCSQPQKGALDGEVILGLLFPFHSSEDGKCISSISDVDTIQILEAAKFAVSRFNQRYSIPGLKIGLEAWDSCRSEEIAVERSLLFLGDRVNVIDSNGDVCPNRKLRIGMVADEISSTSRAVASLLTNAWTPQISYGGTAPDLSDKEKYPYLLRTVPSDKYQAQAMVDVAKRIGWKYVNVIYTEEDDHQRAFQAFKDIAGEQGICFANELRIKQKTTVLAAFESFLADFSRKPNAKAVVAFVTQEHAGYLLKAAQENGHLDLQWFFSYEGMTNPIVLIQGAPLAARGMMGMAPAIFTVNVQDFDDYFRSLTPAPEIVSTESNPWFAEYWQEKYQCNLPGSSKYPSQCDQTAIDSHSSSYISYPYIPTTLNAVDTFSSVVRDLHDSLCGINHAGICDEMLTVDSDELLQKLKQVTLQATDNMMEVNFDDNGDIAPIYDIANYNGSVFSLVGNWTSGILSLDVSKVTMWVGDDPKTGSDLPVSECGSPCTDSQCDTAEEKKVYIPGDVILGGIFPIHGKGSSDQDCGTLDAEGVIQLEAMLFALEQINEDSNILPTIQLGMESIDSCLSGDLASPLTLKFISTGEFGSSGSGERISTETGQREYIFGVVGGADDDVCKAVVEVLQVYMIPEISYKAGVAALSNAWNYPNFLRTVPPDTIQMAALIQVMAKLGWSYIQAIHIESTYGWDCTSVLRQQAPQAGICLTQYFKVRDPSSDDQIDEVLTQLAKRPLAKGIVIIGPVDLAVAVLRGIKRNSLEGKYYLIRSDTQGQEMLPDDVLDVARGTVTVSQRQRRAEQFVSHMTSLTPQSNNRNPWFDEYWMQKFQCVLLGQDANCSDSDRLKAEDIPINTVASVMDAVGAFAHALDELHKTLCYQSDKVCDSLSDLPGEELIQKLKGLRFQSLAGDGKTVYFNYQGDDNGEFDLYNFVQDGDKYKYIQVGTYDRVKLLEMTNNITFYTSDGEVMASPPISNCIGPCDDCKAFKKAKVGEMLGGDIWIGGLFEMRKPGETLIDCSDDLVMYNIQLLEAFYFALDQVNADNTTLPDLKLGAVAFDTCGLVERGVRETTNFVTGGVEYRSNYPPSRIRVSGMIGGSTSDVSIEVAEVLTTLQVSQISYGATSSELSSDDFPFFMRTVPSDVDQAAAIVDVIASLDWRYVSVVFTDNEYGTDMRDKFTAAVRESDICIAMSLLLNVDATTTEFDFVVESLETQVQSRVAILFTSDIQTAKLLQAAEKKGFTDVQWFGTDTWGDRISIAENATSTSRGAITLQFKRRTSDKFKEYFTSLPAYNNARNPWWSQWYMHHFQCNLNVWGVDKPYDVPCPWNLELSEGFVEEAGVGYVTNAVWAFAKGMHEAMLELCPNKTNHLCHEVVLNPEVLNAKILEAKFKGHGDVDFSFDSDRNGPAEYDILNLQVINNTLQHVKIGEWTSGKLHLNSQQIKTYNSSGQVVPLPTFKCEGRCLECLHVTDAKPKHTELPGKLQIAGLFAVHEQGDHRIECGSIREEGITYVEAMLHAIDVINSNSSILPGITLGATVLDTCSSASQAVRELSPLLSGAYFMSNDRRSSSVPVIAGVVGADTNEVTSSLVQTADSYKYSLVSYGATTSLLSNQAAHPFFLRTVPSDENLSDMLIDVITYFGWLYVSVVRSDDLFKKAAMETFMKKAKTSRVCMTTIVEIGTPADYNMAIQKLSNFGDAGAVVLFTNPTDTRNIVQKSASDGKGYLWLFTDDVTQPLFWQGAAPPRDGLSVALGSNTDLQQYLIQLDPRDNERNPWFAQYWRDSFQCNLPGDSEYSKDCDPKLAMPTPGYPLVGYVTTAVNAIAKGMHDLLTTKCGAQAERMCSDFIAATPEEFLASITEATFSSSDGLFKFTDGHGPAKYEIWKTNQGGQPTKIGSWNNHSLTVPSKLSLPDVPSVPDVDCRTVECALCVQQMFPASTVGASVTSKNPVNPPVTQMPVFTTKEEPSPMTDKVTDSKRPPLPPAAQTHHVFRLDGGSIWEIIVLCLTAVGVISSFVALLFLLFKLRHPIIRESSWSLNILLLLGIIFLYLLNIAFVVEDSTVSCGIRRFGLSFFYAMCFAALFVKAVRVYRIGKHERRISGPKPKFISALSQTIFYSGVMLSELLLVVEWLLVDPPGVVFQGGAFVCRQGIEAFIVSLLYVYLLIVVTTVIAFLARNSSDVFHESLYILITCVGSILTIITWAIVAVKGPEGYERPAICFGILLNTTLIFILMFIPKIRLILTKHEFFDNASITSNITISDGRSSAFQNPTYNVYGDAVKVDAEDDSKERQSTEDSSAADQDDINPQLVSQNTTSF